MFANRTSTPAVGKKKRPGVKAKSENLYADDVRAWAKKVGDLQRRLDNVADTMAAANVKSLYVSTQGLDTAIASVSRSITRQFERRLEDAIEDEAVRDALRLLKKS